MPNPFCSRMSHCPSLSYQMVLTSILTLHPCIHDDPTCKGKLTNVFQVLIQVKVEAANILSMANTSCFNFCLDHLTKQGGGNIITTFFQSWFIPHWQACAIWLHNSWQLKPLPKLFLSPLVLDKRHERLEYLNSTEKKFAKFGGKARLLPMSKSLVKDNNIARTIFNRNW